MLKTKIIPAILADNLKQFKIQWQKIAGVFAYVQIDIKDGKFVKTKTKFTPSQIKNLTKNHQLEIHLMVNDVTKYLKIWSKLPNVKKIIFHYEALITNKELLKKSVSARGGSASGRKKIIWHWEADQKNINQYLKLLSALGQNKIQAGLAINPPTKIIDIYPLVKYFHTITIMNVTPGKMGQQSQPGILKKIKTLRKKYPKLNIEIDGGVNDKTARKLKTAGANLLASGSYLQQADNIKLAIKKLK